MSPEPGTAVAPVTPSQETPGAQPKRGRLAGWLLVAVGALLLVLTTGQAFAGTVTGGWGEDALRGTDRQERLAGFGGMTVSGGSPGTTSSPAAGATMSSTAARGAT